MRRQSDGFRLSEGESGEIGSQKNSIRQELCGDALEFV